MVESKTRFDGILVRGAREHNLKNIDVQIPRNQITVLTGLSGSGKSSIAFDIIYAEGQRRYVESLSAYARHFMEQLKKPDVDAVLGLSPSIAIDQRTISTNPRSTVGTVTEVYDFLRLLFARVGVPYCPEHQIAVDSQTPQQILQEILRMKKGTKFYISAPMAQSKKGEFHNEFAKWLKKGFVRAKVDGQWIELEKAKKLAKHKRHDIDLMIDRLVVEDKYKSRLAESIHLALSLSGGLVKIETLEGEEKVYSIHAACPVCSFSFPELEPRLFSFNNPKGACSTCDGLGSVELVDYEVSDKSDDEIEEIDEYEIDVCPDCQGQRLRPEALNVRLADKNIAYYAKLPTSRLHAELSHLDLKNREETIAKKILQQILSRLEYMIRVGTSYLSLDRPTRTLSGGEVQRIRLATQVGSALVGVLYVLDEPSIGLHPRDHHRLLEIINEIKDRGNTIIMVEHDEDTIRSANHIIDMGPGAGRLGGFVSAAGNMQEICENEASLTGKYLSGRFKIPFPGLRREGHGRWLKLSGARGNNLKNVDLTLPLGTLCGITGVSGSGKSTLVIDTLYRHLANELNGAHREVAPFDSIDGLEAIDKIIEINQKPIGRTPRSTPATYVGVFPMIRDLYASLPESQLRGYRPGHFSFNVKGGRCEVCQGGGQIRVEMHFLSDVYIQCDACMGQRYSPEILNIRFREKNIADVLNMSVDEAVDFFKNHRHIHRKLDTLRQTGLGYIHLGQSSTTLSGGEAQRVKLSKELSKRGTGKTLYILDEPTTGLHFEDVRKLIELLHELVDQGNTVVVIEHHMDVIKNCDWLIDLGPEGGDEGGIIVAEGSPEDVVKEIRSVTGQFLKPYLQH